ncbi:hypothetical protein [Vallitalea guaymasensis]|uniref:hypothetical protein n=1 Tax=Vallitalea guaymasensis TaxID=1185412 RepID=UPI000DE1FA75|nr:hypothetical protein [Vallitalea guaymasensis]
MNDLRYRQVHLDFHTSEYIPRVAENFDGDDFASTLKDAHINSITCFARCHHGYLYYPSKSQPDMIHPNLVKKDLLLQQIEACHKYGIKAPIYTTVQWDGYIARKHPEWLAVDEEGKYINSQDVPDANVKLYFLKKELLNFLSFFNIILKFIFNSIRWSCNIK